MSDTLLAQRVRQMAPSITLAITAKAKALKAAGVDVIGFGAGEPDFDTPGFIKEEAGAALVRGETKYTPVPAAMGLREAISAKFKEQNGLDYPATQISVAAGGKHMLYVAMQALLDPGDEVVVLAPYWVSYPEQAKLAGGRVVEIRGDEADGFKVTPAQLEAALTAKTKIVVLNSPSNPAGHGYTADEQAALGAVIAKFPRVVVFSDEIYEHLIYDGFEHVSFAKACPDLFDRTVTFNCHSKSFSMTGWRVGYAGGPAEIIKACNGLISQMTSHITSFIQSAAALALTDPRGMEAVAEMRESFVRRRALMHRLLNALPGVTCVEPQGAFYCFPNIAAHLGAKYPTAVEFAAALLDEAHVAVVPGNDSGFDTHVRLSFATSDENIERGIERVGKWLGKK
ncbi:MAG: pyridoxal phosphate-dependent aminotransferase [Planctomycetota bacterium]